MEKSLISFNLSPRWKKVLADLTANKLRTLLLVLSIAVGVFAVGAMAGAYVIFQRDMSSGWNSVSPANATIYADPFDNDIVQTVRNIRGIHEAEGRRNLEVRVQTGPDKWQSMLMVAIPDYKRMKVNVVKPLIGAWPPPEGQILLERTSYKALAKNVGDTVEIETPEGKKKRLRIAGVVHDLSQVPTFFTGRLYGYITFDTVEALGEERKVDQLNIQIKDIPLSVDPEEYTKLYSKKAWTKLEQSDTNVYWLSVNKPGEHPLQDAINAMLLLMGVIALLSLFLSVFLLINTVSSIVTQQIRQIGIMKTIGARNSQIISMYMLLVTAYGILSLFLAVPLGGVSAYAVAKYMAELFNFDIRGFSIPWTVFLLEVFIALLVPLLAALYPVLHGVTVTVREAINDYGISGAGRSSNLIDRLTAKIRGLPRPIILSLRNTFRRKGRLFLTLTTLIISGTVFMAVFSVRESLFLTSDEALDYFKYDISVVFSDSERIPRIEQEVYRIPGVAKAECWGYTSARILLSDRPGADDEASSSVFLMAPPTGSSMINPILTAGRWLLPEDENAIVLNSEALKDRSDIKINDTITLKIGHRKTKWVVVGMVRGIMTGPMAYTNYPYFSFITREANRARSVQISTTVTNQEQQEIIARALEKRLKTTGLKIASLDITPEVKQRIRAQFNIITVFLLIMAVLLAIIGGLGLMGTMSINVLERTREIGVMRAIGASTVSIIRIFISEGILIGVISWFIGMWLSIFASRMLSFQVGVMFLRAPLSYVFSFTGVFAWLIIVVGLSGLASILPAWNAARMSVRDILSYE